MNILFLTPEIYYGGAGTILRMLANGLAERGHEITIGSEQSLQDIGEYSSYFDLNEKIKVLHPIFPTHYDLHFRPLNLLNYHRKIRGNIRKMRKESKADVIISFMAMINGKMILNNLFSGVPIIATEHSAVNRRYDADIEKYRRLAYPLADAVTVLTTSDLKLWEKHKNVVLMPNPVVRHSDPTPTNREKIVLAAGRITGWEVKGFDTLIKIWSKLEAAHPDWRLVIAGIADGTSMQVLQDLVNRFDLKHIEFPGQIKDLSAYMRNVEIFVMTSRFEGFPIALTEAMDAECCCISFDCDNGPRDIIEHGVSGYLVENQNEDKMTAELDRLMNHEDLRRAVKANARKPLQKFNIDTILDRWEALMKAVVEHKPLTPFRQ